MLLNLAPADDIGDDTTLELNGARASALRLTQATMPAPTRQSRHTPTTASSVLDVTDPGNIPPRRADDNTLELNGARGIAIFEIDTGDNAGTYAAVASEVDDGVQILDVTDPGNITATDQIDATTYCYLTARPASPSLRLTQATMPAPTRQSRHSSTTASRYSTSPTRTTSPPRIKSHPASTGYILTP